MHGVARISESHVVRRSSPQLVAFGAFYSARQVQEVVHQARSVVDATSQSIEPSEAAARRLLASSHRLAYSSFAPLLGEHLLAAGPHQPPVPSAYHMQHSWLTDTGLCAAASSCN